MITELILQESVSFKHLLLNPSTMTYQIRVWNAELAYVKARSWTTSDAEREGERKGELERKSGRWKEAEISAVECQSCHLLWCGSVLGSDKSYIIWALQAGRQGHALSALTRSILPRLNQCLAWSNLTGSPQVLDKLLTTLHHLRLHTHIHTQPCGLKWVS